jgi:hypothetical protein
MFKKEKSNDWIFLLGDIMLGFGSVEKHGTQRSLFNIDEFELDELDEK